MTHELKKGDTLLAVRFPKWGGARSYRPVIVTSVRANGRVCIDGEREQWRLWKARGSEPDHYVKVSQGWSGHNRLYHDTPELRAEIDAERGLNTKRHKLNEIGDALAKVRHDETGAELFDLLPEEIKNLIENGEPT